MQDTLTEQDLSDFEEQGYVIVRQAVPQSDLDDLMEMFNTYLGLEPSTWYQPPHRQSGFVELYQHRALWQTRQRPRVYQAFAQLFGRARVRVGVDRASMKLPVREEYPGWGSGLGLHWDIVHKQPDPIPLGLQGVLAVTDTDETMGGFFCVSGIHKYCHEWQINHASEQNPMRPDVTGLELKPVPCAAGSLIIWHVGLLHGSLPNHSERPRFVQYIKMHRAPDSETVDYDEAREQFDQRVAEDGQDKEKTGLSGPLVPLPKLTDLGRWLAGLGPLPTDLA